MKTQTKLLIPKYLLARDDLRVSECLRWKSIRKNKESEMVPQGWKARDVWREDLMWTLPGWNMELELRTGSKITLKVPVPHGWKRRKQDNLPPWTRIVF